MRKIREHKTYAFSKNHKVVCEICSKHFDSNARVVKYCSDKCRVIARKEREREWNKVTSNIFNSKST